MKPLGRTGNSFYMNEYYKGKRILITGHTGFKGAWLTRLLVRAGAEVHGISLKEEKNSIYDLEPNLGLAKSEYLDIRDREKINDYFSKNKFDGVFHLAAQALVRRSYKDPIFTFETNVMGAANILDSLNRHQSANWVVVVTSDKVYANNESLHAYKENDNLGGKDPYSASKAATEMVATTWRNLSEIKSGMKIVTARAGNVIGGGDHSEDRLLPDLIRNFKLKRKTIIRNPNSVRPWQHVLDPLNGYLRLGEMMVSNNLGAAYNFGPDYKDVITVKEIADLACATWKDSPGYEIQQDSECMPESNLLLLNSSKSKEELNWYSVLSARDAVKWTIDWEFQMSEMGILPAMDLDISRFEQLVNL